MAEADASGAFPIWHVRALGPDGQVAWVAVVQSARQPDGTTLSLPEPDALEAVGEHAVGYARFTGDQVTRLEVTQDAAPKAPPLWFAQLDDPDAKPQPATSLVAFTGHGVEAGTLLDRAALRDVAVKTDDQLAAFRWYPGSGFGDQVYVSPQWRRRTIGTGILAAAGTLVAAHGWTRLWGDGQRTAEGERMYRSSRWSHLSEPQTHILPPMTPDEERPTASPEDEKA